MSSASSVKAGQAQGVVGDYQLALDNGDLEGIVATLSTTATPASRVGGVCAPRRGGSTYGQYTKRCNFRLLFASSTELPRAVILEKPEFWHCRFSGSTAARQKKLLVSQEIYMVPEVEVEPTRGCPHRILSPIRIAG